MKAISIKPEKLRSLEYTGIGAAFAPIPDDGGAAVYPTRHPVRMLLLQNFTNYPLMFSFDGTNNHLPVDADSFILLDVCSNKNNEAGFFIDQATTFYIKEITTTPTQGSFYITTFYGE